MPSASDELRDRIVARFGDLDAFAPLNYLREQGWTENAGYLTAPSRLLTPDELDAANFLVDEWDFASVGT